jgi:hypothetical protein
MSTPHTNVDDVLNTHDLTVYQILVHTQEHNTVDAQGLAHSTNQALNILLHTPVTHASTMTALPERAFGWSTSPCEWHNNTLPNEFD